MPFYPARIIQCAVARVLRGGRGRRTGEIAGLVLCGLLSQSAAAEVSISASIKPLQMIARAVAGEFADVTVLADDSQSAHQFTLLPADRVNLERADIVLWVGPEFEVQLSDFLARHAGRTAVITGTKIPRVGLLELSPDVIDPHIWLSLDNAEAIAETVASELAAIDPTRAGAYRSNLQRFSGQLRRLREQISRDFEATRPGAALPAFAVYHNAFQYFESEAGIAHGLALVHDPEREPGIREILAARDRIAALKPRCLFMEPGVNPGVIDAFFRGAAIRKVSVDLLGQLSGSVSYYELIAGLSTAMSDCLRESLRER